MNIAFIPVRGGSKSIPLKNIKPICGKPLVYWTIKAACDCKYIDKVYVSTDSEKIKEVVKSFKEKKEVINSEKLFIVDRSIESASDTASTESAMLEFATKYQFDNIVLIQATSPLLSSLDLVKGFKLYNEEDTDSVLSVVRQKRFHWVIDKEGYAHSSNYDVFNRPRRQEFDGYLVENGAFYITSKEGLLESRNRVSGNIKTIEMSEDSFFEIDEPSDWVIVEALLKKKNKETFNNLFSNIKMFLTDCDGCLTDGGMYYSEKGDELKKFNTRDGMGFSLLKSKGIITGIITSEDVNLNKRRAEKLKLDVIEQGIKNKLDVIKRLSQDYSIPLSNIAYVGDDINDLEVIKAVGFGCCPNNAVDEVKSVSSFVAKSNGGNGVIREIADFILNNT